MSIDVGITLPTSTPDPAQPILGNVVEAAKLAESLGLDSVWSTDHLQPSGPMVDGTVALAAAAGATERITIGFNVYLLALRPVAWAAKQISSLQYVSNDRLVLGVGTGNPVHGDTAWRAAGQPFAGRGRRTDEALELLPALVTGVPTTVDDDVEVTVAPGATMPPVLVAGDGAKAKQRTARFAQSWVTIALSPEQVAAPLAELAALAEGFGRPAPTATIVVPPLPDDPSAIGETLAAYEAAGVERLILPVTSPDWQRDYDRAAQVRAAY